MNTDNERFISFMALTQRGVSESGGQFGVGRGGNHTRLRVFRAAPSLPGGRIHGLLRVEMRCRCCTKVQAKFPARASETTREGAWGPLWVKASKVFAHHFQLHPSSEESVSTEEVTPCSGRVGRPAHTPCGWRLRRLSKNISHCGRRRPVDPRGGDAPAPFGLIG